MTWDQLQQLRAMAKGEIQKHLEQMRPRAGHGVSINGNSISLQAQDNEDQEVPPLLIAIWISVEGQTVHTKPGEDSTTTFSFPLELAVQVRPNGSLQSTYAHEKTQVANIISEGSTLIRTARITFEQRPFLFPVRLRLEQRDQFGNVYATNTVDMPTGRASYEARAQEDNVFLEVHIAAISSL